MAVVWHIDDDDIQLELVSLILQNVHPQGQIVSFGDAQRALEQMRTHGLPDILVLDLNMPLVNGWDVLQEMARRKVEVPTWILTSSIDLRDRTRANSFLSVKGFLIKPLNAIAATAIFAA